MHCYLFMTFFAATVSDDYLFVSEVSVLPRFPPVSAVGPVGLCIVNQTDTCIQRCFRSLYMKRWSEQINKIIHPVYTDQSKLMSPRHYQYMYWLNHSRSTLRHCVVKQARRDPDGAHCSQHWGTTSEQTQPLNGINSDPLLATAGLQRVLG